MDGIFAALHEGALTMQQGGGIGYDFSTLRPRGCRARATGTIASGPVSFMQIWDAMCATLLSTGSRRGAMMATLRCDHPDIEDFVTAKRDPDALRHFNLSVQVTDEFMAAVRHDQDWPLVFPAEGLDDAVLADHANLRRGWTGSDNAVACRVLRTVPARELWERIVRCAYDCAEPGVLFIDTINRQNNLYYRENLTATNPCGEIPLPPYGACNLGSINLTAFVQKPFHAGASLNLDFLADTAAVATRFLDNVIGVSAYPLEAQRDQAHGTRRLGLGITGLADALIMLGLRYDSEAGRATAAEIMRLICHTVYRTSTALASEKGPFPFYERDAFVAGPFIDKLPGSIRDEIAHHGIRNSHLIAIAHAGTISLLANNVSSGIEPVFAAECDRRVFSHDGHDIRHVTDYAWRAWQENHRGVDPGPPAFVCARDLSPGAHLDMVAALQPSVDNAISKTVTVPDDYAYDSFRELYGNAWQAGLKGCTTFRANPITGSILGKSLTDRDLDARHCCTIDREAD